MMLTDTREEDIPDQNIFVIGFVKNFFRWKEGLDFIMNIQLHRAPGRISGPFPIRVLPIA